MEPKKVWTKDEIKSMLNENDRAVARGVLAIYNRQTDGEKIDDNTHESNGVGFNKIDAEILSSFARWFYAHGYLTEKQTAIARKKIMKYAGQLVEIANA